MEQIPFNIQYRHDIESGKYLVVTRDGNSVRIVCWDRKGPYHILGLIKTGMVEIPETFLENGSCIDARECESDLFLILNPDYKEPSAEPSVSPSMELIWHHNTWPWGKSVKIIKSDGGAIVEMTFENTNPGVCYLSCVSVIEPLRRQGIATHLMLTCESYCREQGIFRIDLCSVLTPWVQDFYKKCGYIPIKEEDESMQMYKILNK